MFLILRYYIFILILMQTLSQEFSTNLHQLERKIRAFTSNLHQIPANAQQNITIPFKPLNTFACDTQNFQKQTTNYWQKYTSLITDNTPGKRTQFSPDHHSYYFKKILWSPDEWTTIAHNHIAREQDFEMIYLQFVKKPLYVIYNEYGYTDPHNLHYADSGDTTTLISRIVAYFYEHFTFVKFKLFTNLSKTLGEFRGLCYLSANKFPLIKEVLLTSQTTQYEIKTPCNEDRLVRLHTLNSKTYIATFPKTKISNEVPQVRNIQQYEQQIGYNYVLDFQWSTLTDQGFALYIELGEKLTYLPRIWWIQEQSNSLLGFHKNFFLPEYLQTIQTTYSYARNMRHYYAEGFYAKKPGVKYLRQNVDEYTPVITSWPIPSQTINQKHPRNTYFKPHRGNLETTLSKIFQIVTRPPHIAQISICQNYTENFRTIQNERSNYHQNLNEQQPPLLSHIYSYKQKSLATNNDQGNNVKQANLQRRIDDKAQLSRLLGNNVQSHMSNLEHNLLTYQFESSEETRLNIEKRIHHKIWTDYATTQAHSKAQYAYAQLLYEINHLSAVIPTLHKTFREMYAMILQHKAIRLLRNDQQLPPHILYQHIINSDSITTTPLKYDATRENPLQALTAFLIASSTANRRTFLSSPILTSSQEFSTRIPQTTSSALETQQTKSINQYAEYNNNQTHNPVPWPWPNVKHSRPHLPTLQYVISKLQRQIFNLIHNLNSKYISTKHTLIRLFKEYTNCDT